MPGFLTEVGRVRAWEPDGTSPLKAQTPGSAFRLMPIVPLPARRYSIRQVEPGTKRCNPFSAPQTLHPCSPAGMPAPGLIERPPSNAGREGCQTRPAGRRMSTCRLTCSSWPPCLKGSEKGIHETWGYSVLSCQVAAADAGACHFSLFSTIASDHAVFGDLGNLVKGYGEHDADHGHGPDHA